jgi:diacylglycerol kinase
MSGLDPFRWAATGVARTLATERHLRIHWISAIAVMLVLSAIEVGLGAKLALWGFVALVIAAELINSAIERTIDGVSRERSTWARDAKDAAAGAVLVLAVFAASSLAVVLAARWAVVVSSGPAIARTLVFGGPMLVASWVVLFRASSPRSLVVAGAIGAAGAGPLLARTHDRASALLAVALILVATISRLREQARRRTA